MSKSVKKEILASDYSSEQVLAVNTSINCIETHRVVSCLQMGLIFVDSSTLLIQFFGQKSTFSNCVRQKGGHTNDSHQRQKVTSEVAQEPEGFGT